MRCRYGTDGAAMWLTGTFWHEDCGYVAWSGRQDFVSESLVARPATRRYIAGLGNASDIIPVRIMLHPGDRFQALEYASKILWRLPRSGELRFVEQRDDQEWTCTYAKAVFIALNRRILEGDQIELEYQFEVNSLPTTSVVGGVPPRVTTQAGTYIVTQ